MKEQFKTISFRSDTMVVIGIVNQVIAGYKAAGYKLTLRQLYYQMIAKDLLPDSWIDENYNRKNQLPLDTKNTDKNYKRLGSVVNDGRLAGLIDWDDIEDRTRNLRSYLHWTDAQDRIRSAWLSFRMDKWRNQPVRVECWVEKDALVGILERVCNKYDVPFFSCRGYTSQTEMYEAAKRLNRYVDSGLEVVIIHLGDHDPSGIDMSRDVRERLEMFMSDSGADVQRIALNWDQVQFYNPPPNPAKTTDARYNDYANKFGYDSWELDSLEPQVIEQLIEDKISQYIDGSLWAEAEEEEKDQDDLLKQVYQRWHRVRHYLGKDGSQ